MVDKMLYFKMNGLIRNLNLTKSKVSCKWRLYDALNVAMWYPIKRYNVLSVGIRCQK